MRKSKLTCGAGILAALLLTVVVASGVVGPTRAQDLVKASFTLSGDTRFGTTVLPAGQYTLLVEPITSLRAVGSPVAIAVRPDNASRPFAAVLATAWQEGCGKDELKLVSRGTGFVAQSMCLGKQQLLLHFDGSGSRGNPL
jgi:hypothetical protein